LWGGGGGFTLWILSKNIGGAQSIDITLKRSQYQKVSEPLSENVKRSKLKLKQKQNSYKSKERKKTKQKQIKIRKLAN
jgi:hypothetical protein